MNPTAPRRSARAVVDLASGRLLASVEIAAPPEAVFRALTESAEVTGWWGSPEAYQTTEWTADLRVGGSWRAVGKGADGHPFSVRGRFLEVDPPLRLVQTWVPDWEPEAETTVAYALEAIPTGTRLTVRHEGFAERRESAESHSRGWELVLGWLDSHFSPKAQRFFFCRLLHTRSTFPADATPAELKVMGAHAAYWTDLCARGTAVIFGPVADPKGVFGVGILRVRDEAELSALQAHDPVIESGIGMRYETAPMLRAVVRGG